MVVFVGGAKRVCLYKRLFWCGHTRLAPSLPKQTRTAHLGKHGHAIGLAELGRAVDVGPVKFSGGGRGAGAGEAASVFFSLMRRGRRNGERNTLRARTHTIQALRLRPGDSSGILPSTLPALWVDDGVLLELDPLCVANDL